MAVLRTLTIAGSDSGGGAGIQADIKTFSALQTYGMSVITAVTAQNTQTISSIAMISPDVIHAQLTAIFSDIPPQAIKTGMLGDADVITLVAHFLAQYPNIPLVIDPVMVSKSGTQLLSKHALTTLKEVLIPHAHLITPNLPEAAILLDRSPDSLPEVNETTARALLDLGCKAVLLKGGHANTTTCRDILCTAHNTYTFDTLRIPTHNTHGTGCTLSAAITAYLAHGLPLDKSVSKAKNYVSYAISHADQLAIGSGHGPVHHFFEWWQ